MTIKKLGSNGGLTKESSVKEDSSIYPVIFYDDQGQTYDDLLADEVPLSITAQGEPYATFMRTPGDDEALVIGFLITEGIITDLDDIESITPCQTDPIARLHIRFASGVTIESSNRRSFISSSCGLCSLENYKVRRYYIANKRFVSQTLTSHQIKERLYQFNQLENLYTKTGGAHAAALFNQSGAIMWTATDVGRHNAVDKVIGHAIKSNITDLSTYQLMVSSRAGYEIVLKAIMCGLKILITLGAASGGAHRLAVENSLALYSFARPNRVHRHQE